MADELSGDGAPLRRTTVEENAIGLREGETVQIPAPGQGDESKGVECRRRRMAGRRLVTRRYMATVCRLLSSCF